jgi:hypothetical protein
MSEFEFQRVTGKMMKSVLEEMQSMPDSDELLVVKLPRLAKTQQCLDSFFANSNKMALSKSYPHCYLMQEIGLKISGMHD